LFKKILQKICARVGYRFIFPFQKLETASSSVPNQVLGCLTKNEARRIFHYEQITATARVPGRIVECGVADGSSLVFLTRYAAVLESRGNFSDSILLKVFRRHRM
jgi:hypothetical protein